MKYGKRTLLTASVLAVALGGCASTNRNGEDKASKPGGVVSDTELHKASGSRAITGRGRSTYEDRAPNYNGSSEAFTDQEGETFEDNQLGENQLDNVETDATLSGTTNPWGETNELESRDQSSPMSQDMEQADAFDENVVDSYSVEETRDIDEADGTMSGMTESASEDEEEDSVSGSTSSVTDREWTSKDKKSKKKKKSTKHPTTPTSPTDESTMGTGGTGDGGSGM